VCQGARWKGGWLAKRWRKYISLKQQGRRDFSAAKGEGEREKQAGALKKNGRGNGSKNQRGRGEEGRGFGHFRDYGRPKIEYQERGKRDMPSPRQRNFIRGDWEEGCTFLGKKHSKGTKKSYSRKVTVKK